MLSWLFWSQRGKVADALAVCDRAELALVTNEYNFAHVQLRTGPGVDPSQIGKGTSLDNTNMAQVLRILEVGYVCVCVCVCVCLFVFVFLCAYLCRERALVSVLECSCVSFFVSACLSV
jgi:hypothetical protein